MKANSTQHFNKYNMQADNVNLNLQVHDNTCLLTCSQYVPIMKIVSDNVNIVRTSAKSLETIQR